ncbi:MAG TPA: deoxyribodipyrimidine photo-lyase [Ignavibacteria bacterium]|nr:deoxyribodipyrimidine photo-lyase [Ignavibacteria bacterium]HMQ98891.1 deoxyribodipyrimidine photo-lyase [Ignavibacteria bacterium]
MKDKINIFWFRRDLRLEDNTGLYHALKAGIPVLPIFIFDTEILDKLENKLDARVEFIHNALTEIDTELRKYNSSLLTLAGKPADVFMKLTDEYDISEVFTNHDYEPYAIKRDSEIDRLLSSKGIKFNTFKDQVIFEKNEVVKPDGKPYSIYTPYSKTWRAQFNPKDIEEFPLKDRQNNFYKIEASLLSLDEIGFKKTGMSFPSKVVREDIIKNYGNTRDIPSIDGTSRLSVHLRFGTVSPRRLVKLALKLSDVWLSELIWREFFMMILYHYPHSALSSFKPEYGRIKWRNDETEFNAWCKGETGFPIVDAGMRELNATGFMHNRVRMITASFLCKDLLIDWRWGERFFAEKLLDYEMSSNVGNWQWAAGTGCDAAPYFRIFNPASQQEKFDPELSYVKKWVPEYGSFSYHKPMVDHKAARERTLIAYKKALDRL